MRPEKALLVIGLLLSALEASEPVSTPTPAQLKSHDWWRQLAVHYADEIADVDARGQADYELAYVRAGAGDLDGARVSAARINNPQLRVHAHCFVAKQYKQKGDDDACRAELRQARQVALGTKTGQAHSHVIRAYLKMGYAAEARSFAAEFPEDRQRKYGFQQIAAALAGRGDLDQAYDVLKSKIPPNWREGTLSMMANACARERRVKEVEQLAGQLTNTKYRDNAYVNLVEALVRADRHVEAAEFTDRISDPVRRAAARATITRRSVKDESAKALRSRIAKAETREEKLALYNVLFTRLVETGDVAAAEAAIESMVKTIEASPRKAQASKFGQFDDAVAIAGARSKYMTIAELLANRGDREGSLRRIARATKAVTELPEQAGLAKMMLVSRLVKSQIAAGDLDGARGTLDKIGMNFSRSSAAADLAVALIKSGDVKSALEVAELITAPNGKGLAVGSVVSELLRAGEPAAAKAVLRRLGDSKEEVRAFRAAGSTMVELGHERQLHQWLAEMTSNVARAHACMGAAQTLQKK